MATTKKLQIVGGFPQSDWSQEDATAFDYIKNKPENLARTDQNNNFTALQTFNENVIFEKDVNIKGNVNEVHTQQVNTESDEIILRKGAITGLGEGQFAKITAEKYDGTNDGMLGFDNTGTARVGDVGDEQALATRDEATKMIHGHLLAWDGNSYKIVDSGEIPETIIDKLNIKNGAGAYSLQQKTNQVVITSDISKDGTKGYSYEPELFELINSIPGYEDITELEVGKAEGVDATALNYQTLAQADRGLSAGSQTLVLQRAVRSVAINTKNIVDGANGFGGGHLCLVLGNEGFAHGKGLVSAGDDSGQAVFGKYNKRLGKAQFMVGIGTDKEHRKNGLVVLIDGSVLGGKSTGAEDDELAFTTKDYVDNKHNQIRTEIVDSDVENYYRSVGATTDALTFTFDVAQKIAQVHLKANTSITDIVIPDKCYNIADNKWYSVYDMNVASFRDSNITSIVIPDSIHQIYDDMFNGCTSLQKVKIGSRITGINQRVFQNCSSLESIVIPKNVTALGDYALFGCSSLESIVIENDTNVLTQNYGDCIPNTIEKVILPLNLLENYKTATSWSRISDKMVSMVDTEYIEEYGGKIDSISLNNVPLIIDENKNIDINIPKQEKWRTIQHITLTEDIHQIEFTQDMDGNSFNLKKARLTIKGKATNTGINILASSIQSSRDWSSFEYKHAFNTAYNNFIRINYEESIHNLRIVNFYNTANLVDYVIMNSNYQRYALLRELNDGTKTSLSRFKLFCYGDENGTENLFLAGTEIIIEGVDDEETN